MWDGTSSLSYPVILVYVPAHRTLHMLQFYLISVVILYLTEHCCFIARIMNFACLFPTAPQNGFEFVCHYVLVRYGGGKSIFTYSIDKKKTVEFATIFV